jgi:acylphosphatase
MEYFRVHIFITGKVQGVYFRQNAALKAQELNVSGWIRNLKDGRVEAVFEGEKANINKLLNWCKQGPKDAIVRNTEVINEPFKNEYSDFQIIKTA